MRYIRNVSTIVLWAVLIISAVIAALFYFGGVVPETQRIVFDQSQPTFTGLFIDWVLLIVCISVILVLSISIHKMAKDYRNGVKRTVVSFAFMFGILFLLIVTWLLGSGSFWYRIADMWLYTVCFLSIAALLLVLFFSFRRLMCKRKG
jgi:hypothetical protein